MQPENEALVVKCAVLEGAPLPLGPDLELRFKKLPLGHGFYFGVPELYQNGTKLDLAISSVTLHFANEDWAEASVCFYPRSI